MPRKNAATVSSDVPKKVVRHRKPLTNKKYFAPPLSAEQISKGVGVTKKDAAIVDKVLRKLGYIRDEEPAKGKTAKEGTVKSPKN